MTMNTPTSQNESNEDFLKIDLISEKFDLDPAQTAMAQVVLVIRNMVRNMNPDQLNGFLTGGVPMIMKFANFEITQEEVDRL